MIVRFFGRILIAIGSLLGLFALLGGLIDKSDSGKYVAIFLGVLGLILLTIGYRWTRSKQSTSWRSDPATDRQREFANELGIKFSKNITKGELSDLISEVTER